MEPRVEIQPENTLFILGTDFASSLVARDSSYIPPLTYSTFKTQLTEAAKTVGQDNATTTVECLRVLKENRILHQWLQETFSLSDCTLLQTPLLQRIIDLQRLGALVVYLHPDTVCEEAMQQPGFSMDQADTWVTGGEPGILHPFGLNKKPNSLVKWSSGCDQLSLPTTFTNVLQNRVCICIGLPTEPETEESFTQMFMQLLHIHSPNFPLCVGAASNAPWSVLHIHNVQLPRALCSAEDTSRALGELIEFPPSDDDSVSLSLLLGTKNRLSDVTKLISTCAGVNFVLLSTIHYKGLTLHPLSIRVTKKLFNDFWLQLLSPAMITKLIENVVLAIVFSHSTFIWLNKGNQLTDFNTNGIKNCLESLANNTMGHNSPQRERQTPSPTAQAMSPPQHKSANKTIPRWTIKKQKISNGLANKLRQENGAPVPPGILKRRLSLPPHLTLPPPQHLKTKPYSTNINISARHQMLISKYLFSRKHRESPEARNATQLKRLLLEKPKVFPKPDTTSKDSPLRLLNEMTFKRRKDLFFEENEEWSQQMDKILSQKVKKWERLRLKRRQAIIKKEREEEQRETKMASADSSGVEGVLRQQLVTPLHYPTDSLSVQPSVMSNVNPFLLPSTNSLQLGPTSLMYPSPLLPSYPYLTLPITSSLAYYLPTMLPQQATPSNLYVVSNGSTVVTSSAANITTSPRTQNGYSSCNTSKLKASLISTMTTPTINSFSQSNHISNPKIGQKRPHTHHTSSTPSPPTNNYSHISSLLKKEPTSPPLKRSRVITNPVMDDRSDGEESTCEGQSPAFPEEQQQTQLWQFLLDLLLSNTNSDYIQWNPYATMEFLIKEPKEVAKLWSSFLGEKSMDYVKFRRALHYYCTKSPPILYPVENRQNAYRFSHSVLYYINMRYSQHFQSSVSTTKANSLSKARDVSGSREVLVVD